MRGRASTPTQMPSRRSLLWLQSPLAAVSCGRYPTSPHPPRVIVGHDRCNMPLRKVWAEPSHGRPGQGAIGASAPIREPFPVACPTTVLDQNLRGLIDLESGGVSRAISPSRDSPLRGRAHGARIRLGDAATRNRQRLGAECFGCSEFDTTAGFSTGHAGAGMETAELLTRRKAGAGVATGCLVATYACQARLANISPNPPKACSKPSRLAWPPRANSLAVPPSLPIVVRRG
jgi:hypothetical protein